MNNVLALQKLVEGCIASEPYLCDGIPWAARPLEWYCDQLKISVATLRRIISKPPFERERVQYGGTGGKMTTLLRVGEPDPNRPRRVARVLERIWLDVANKKPVPQEFGLLTGLAKDLPAGFQAKIFKFALEDWSLFMSAVSYVITMENNEAEISGTPLPFEKKFFNYPSISVTRRFWRAAIDNYETHLQDAEKHAELAEFNKALAAKAK